MWSKWILKLLECLKSHSEASSVTLQPCVRHRSYLISINIHNRIYLTLSYCYLIVSWIQQGVFQINVMFSYSNQIMFVNQLPASLKRCLHEPLILFIVRVHTSVSLSVLYPAGSRFSARLESQRVACEILLWQWKRGRPLLGFLYEAQDRSVSKTHQMSTYCQRTSSQPTNHTLPQPATPQQPELDHCSHIVLFNCICAQCSWASEEPNISWHSLNVLGEQIF